jgi:hypothetical protein
MPLFIGWFFISPSTFVAGGVFLTGLYSLYANWATDNGAASAARAVLNTSQPSSRDIVARPAYSLNMSILTIIYNWLGGILDKHHTTPTTPSAVSPTVAVINESTALTDAQIMPIVTALQTQADRDFGPLWNLTCKLVQVAKGGVPPSGAWQLVFLDNADQAGALGYHDFTAEGKPIAKVFVKTAEQYGYSVSVTASHELCEMLADAGCDLSAQADNQTFVAYEACDPCEDDSLGYAIDGVQMSDFVTPEYFMATPPAGAKLDFMGHLHQPFTIATGGYLNVWTPSGGWSQQTNGHSNREVTRETRGS